MNEGARPPEFILDELVQTGRNWLVTRARERAVGPPSEPGKGTIPAAREDLEGQERVMGQAAALRERFRTLAEEFMDRVEEV
jgi:hypothetical protein